MFGFIESQIYHNITNCYNTGNISGTQYTGGFIGFFNASSFPLTNCYNTGNVSGAGRTGGLMGCTAGGTINKC